MSHTNPDQPGATNGQPKESGVSAAGALPQEVNNSRVQAAPSVLSSLPNLTTLWTALRRRLVLALTLGTLLAAIAGGTVMYMYKPTYTARSYVKVEATQPSIIGNAGPSIDFGMYQRSQVAMVKSRLVLNAAL